LRLTTKQKQDAVTKYTAVAKLLHNEFYTSNYDGSTKRLIGSYGKKTNIRPPTDVDLLFKIDADTYDRYIDSPDDLLQRIRKVLSARYPTTDKISAWGKVVLVEFAEGKHNIELLPAFDIDGVYQIPNTEAGGTWESFDVKADIKSVADSDTATGGNTRKLIKILKRWRRNTPSLHIKPYELEKLSVVFLAQYELDGSGVSSMVRDFFKWLSSLVEDTQVSTALTRAIKAVDYEVSGDIKGACSEWQKVFGKKIFPSYSASISKIFILSTAQPAPDEQYIEDMFPVRIDSNYDVSIISKVTGSGYIPYSLPAFIAKYVRLPRNLSIEFRAETTVPGNVMTYWKVRNFGNVAAVKNELRGEITPGYSMGKKNESTSYLGTHYVECYVIKDGICVAKATQFVPIDDREA
jgi:hypothetical protein